MYTFLTFSAERQRLIYEEGYQKLGLVPASIEKDFWVCFILRELFSLSSWAEHLTFKGGTSLSKGWKLISRFSEDVDVVIDRAHLGFDGETLGSKKRRRLNKECSRSIQEKLRPELEQRLFQVIPGDMAGELMSADDTEDPDKQTLLFNYQSFFSGSFAYLRPVVKIELGARSETEPVESPTIRPYLAEAFPSLLQDSAFALRTVAARRTFWEKAMLLHEENFRPPEKPRKARMSRHYYDLWCLIQKGVAAQATEDLTLFDRVARHRQIFFKQTWVNYKTLQKGTLQILPTQNMLAEWAKDYETMRDVMFFDEPPSFDEILAVIRKFQEEFNRL